MQIAGKLYCALSKILDCDLIESDEFNGPCCVLCGAKVVYGPYGEVVKHISDCPIHDAKAAIKEYKETSAKE